MPASKRRSLPYPLTLHPAHPSEKRPAGRVATSAPAGNQDQALARRLQTFCRTRVNTQQKGAANGIATLDNNGFVTLSQLGSILANPNLWTKAQRGAFVALTDATSIAVDLSLGNNFSVTLGGNRTLAFPTNVVAGQSGIIVVTQDATGSRTLAYGTGYKFASGVAPVLTTTANAVDYLTYFVETSSRIFVSKIGDVK